MILYLRKHLILRDCSILKLGVYLCTTILILYLYNYYVTRENCYEHAFFDFLFYIKCTKTIVGIETVLILTT